MNWKKRLLAAGLILTLALPIGVYAAETDQTPTRGMETAVKAKVEHFRLGFRHFLGLGVHEEEYYRLLAEKYTPEDLNQWEAAFTERESLLTQLKELKENGTLKEEWSAKREEVKAKINELRAKVKNGEMTKEEAKKQIQNYVAERKSDLSPIISAHRELHQAFTAAIDKQDEAAIRALLPKLLDEMEKGNQFLAKKIAELKNGTTN